MCYSSAAGKRERERGGPWEQLHRLMKWTEERFKILGLLNCQHFLLCRPNKDVKVEQGRKWLIMTMVLFPLKESEINPGKNKK